MTDDCPYTDADLRSEAANQHAGLTDDPDFMSVGEAMCDRFVPSTVVEPDNDDTGSTWEELLPYDSGDGEDEAYNTAQRKIHDLIRSAADVSAWAINLGAAGLRPVAEIGVRLTTGGYPLAVQLALDPELTDAARAELITELTTAINATASRVLGCTPVS